VYLETTFISYLVARPSRDVIVAGHQQTTLDWWANRRSEFECLYWFSENGNFAFGALA